MLIKKKDSLEQSIQQLETITRFPNLSRSALERAQRELRTLKAGMIGENNAAYFIDFDFAERKGIAIIHDFRIEHRGYVAQIDHLLISRFLEFYVLESKSFAQGIKITDRGEFLVEYDGGYKAMESPIEQNRRHAIVLEKLLHDNNVLPTRLGLTLLPTILSYVLVSPKSRVKRPSKKSFNTDMVIKADELLRNIQNEDEKSSALTTVGLLAKVVSSETLEQIAGTLVSFHKPATMNYYERFGIDPYSQVQISTEHSSPNQKTKEQGHGSEYFCFKCRKKITQKVALYCFQNKKRFGGKAYCYDCQKSF